jgi:UV DNA damage endonuclease
MSCKIRLGYAGINQTLRKKHIMANRTCRLSTISENGIEYAMHLLKKNLEDLMKILQWNEAHGIRFFRINSDIAPHITNPALINSTSYKTLAYSLEEVRPLLKAIGKYALSMGHRLTFHPDLYLNLSSPSADVARKSMREMWYHAVLMDMMGLGMDSVMVLHGGGAYGNKTLAMKRWIARFNKLPLTIRRRVVLENDEFVYSIDDVLAMAKATCIPVVFDYFHWSIYAASGKHQSTVEEVIPAIITSWKKRTIKMHISEQHPHAPLASHSDYIATLPDFMLKFCSKYKRSLDLMIEAKAKELAVMRLRKKYSNLPTGQIRASSRATPSTHKN